MARFFNTAGPNRPERHYTVPVLARLPDLGWLLESESWFVLHAPRQSGKTTALKALATELTTSGRYAAVRATCEAGEPFRDDPAAASRVVVASIAQAAFETLPEALRPPPPAPEAAPGWALGDFLAKWCAACPLPVVLLLDEIDALQDDGLISVLRQLRALYDRRPTYAPSTVALVGLRDLRDYKVRAGGGTLGTASPFNITAKSLTLPSFTRTEVATLYGQHTAETGQAFSEAAIDAAWAATRGQPWLVNALAHELVHEMGLTDTIEASQVAVAKERLVLTRSTHLQSLAHKLTEPRVRSVIGPLLTGERGVAPHPADVDYCIELGLIERRGLEGLVVANPIYREVLPRELAVAAGDAMGALPVRRWALPDGRLDLSGLLAAFVDFWRKDGEWLVRNQQWPEAAHQLLLMAFLQRVVNGGGTIEREYGLGRMRVDLLIRWAVRVDRWGAMLEADRHAIEVKVWRDAAHDNPVNEGLAQLDAYLDRLGLASGTLVVFDARAEAPGGRQWRERGVLSDERTPTGRTVRLLLA